MIFHDVDQNSEEWFALRLGKATTSKFGIIMANYGKAFGDPAKKYAYRLAYEQVTGEKFDEDTYQSKDMENGHIWEPVARQAYEDETFNEVSNGGFCQSKKYSNVGGSPDGMVLSDNGGIEIKSIIPWTQRANLKRGSFDPSYRWQYLGNMWLCGWDWCDYVGYGFRNTPDKKLFIDRLNRVDHQEDIDKIEPRLEQFLELVEQEKKFV